MDRIIIMKRDCLGNVKADQLVYQYNHGHILQLVGFALPEAWELDCSNSMNGKAVTVQGSGNQAQLPDELLLSGAPVFCWIVRRNGTERLTQYQFSISVIRRAKLPTNREQDDN